MGAPGHRFPQISNLLERYGLLLAVAVAPSAEPPVDKISGGGRCQNHAEQKRMQAGQDGQISGKAEYVRQQLRPDGPDVFRCLLVSGAGVARLVFEIAEPGLHQVGKGGVRELLADLQQDAFADLYAAEQRVFVQVAPEPGKEQQHQAEARDGEEKLRERGGLLHLLQYGRGEKQLCHGLRGRDRRQRRAQKNDAPAALPGVDEHEAGVLPHAVGGFFLLFHSCLTSENTPGGERRGGPPDPGKLSSAFCESSGRALRLRRDAA